MKPCAPARSAAWMIASMSASRAIRPRPMFSRAGSWRRARRCERGEGLPVFEEQARFIELGHVADEAAELSGQLLTRGDRGAGLGDTDAPFDHQIRERAIGERRDERRRSGAEDRLASALP